MAERKIVTFHILFSLAVISVVLGTGLLVITTEKASGAYVYRPLILVTVGALFTYFAVITRLRAKFVFLGFVVTSAAIIRFTGTVLGIGSSRYWPLYVMAAGLSFLPAYYMRNGKLKPGSIVISSAFVLLGLFFSIFSFGFSSMRFKTFLSRWWPALFIASGVVLLLVWLIQRLVLKNLSAEAGSDHASEDVRGGP